MEEEDRVAVAPEDNPMMELAGTDFSQQYRPMPNMGEQTTSPPSNIIGRMAKSIQMHVPTETEKQLSFIGGSRQSFSMLHGATPKKASFQNEGFRLGDAYDRLSDGQYIAKFDNFLQGTNNEERFAQQQTGGQKFNRGIVKFLGMTGTAILGSTVGSVVGLGAAITQGDWTAVYDNDFQNKLDDWNKRMSNSLAHHYTEEEKDMNFLQSMGTGNFWANDFLGGLSFTVGAVAGEAIWAGLTGGASIGINMARRALRASAAAAKNLAMAGKAAKSTSLVLRETPEILRIGRAAKEGSAPLKNILTGFTEKQIKSAKIAGKVGTGLNTARMIYTSAGYEAGVEARMYIDEQREQFNLEFENIHGREPTSIERSEFESELRSTANTIFATNLALVGSSNLAIYGRMFNISNPLKMPAKMFNRTVFGGGVRFGEKGVATAAKRNLFQRVAGTSYNILRAPVIEGVWEEGMQGVTATAAGAYLESTYGDNDEVMGLMESVYEGFSHTYGTKEGFKEVGLGMLIGLVGGGGSAMLSGKNPVAGTIDAARKISRTDAEVAKTLNNYSIHKVTNEIFRARLIDKATQEAGKAEESGDLVHGQAARSMGMMANIIYSERMGYGEEMTREMENALKAIDPKEVANNLGITEAEAIQMKEDSLAEYKELKETYKKNMDFAEYVIGAGKIDSKTVNHEIARESLAYQMTMGDKFKDVSQDYAKAIMAEVGDNSSYGYQLQSYLQVQDVLRRATEEDRSKYNNIQKEYRGLTKELERLEAQRLTQENRLRSTRQDNTHMASALDNTTNQIIAAQEKITQLETELEGAYAAMSLYTLEDSGDGVIIGRDLADMEKNMDSVEQYFRSIEHTNPEKSARIKALITGYRNAIASARIFDEVIEDLMNPKTGLRGSTRTFLSKLKEYNDPTKRLVDNLQMQQKLFALGTEGMFAEQEEVSEGVNEGVNEGEDGADISKDVEDNIPPTPPENTPPSGPPNTPPETKSTELTNQERERIEKEFGVVIEDNLTRSAERYHVVGDQTKQKKAEAAIAELESKKQKELGELYEGSSKKDEIIQTNEPTIQTVGNVTFGTANKQGQTDNNEDAVYVDTQNGVFILADGMGGEGMITHSPSQTSQSVINKLLGKPDENATEILYNEYLKNKNITSEEAVTFLNKNGFNIKGAGTANVSTIINSFKTKGDLTNKKGFRTGATALKAVKTGKNTYTIEKVGDTVYFVVDKNGKVTQTHGLSDVATTQGYIFSIKDGKPYVSTPKIDSFTVTLNEGETLVLATDFIETDKAIQDFIDSDFGKNLNFEEFQKNNKSDDSTFITIEYDAEIAALKSEPTTEGVSKEERAKEIIDKYNKQIEKLKEGTKDTSDVQGAKQEIANLQGAKRAKQQAKERTEEAKRKEEERGLPNFTQKIQEFLKKNNYILQNFGENVEDRKPTDEEVARYEELLAKFKVDPDSIISQSITTISKRGLKKIGLTKEEVQEFKALNQKLSDWRVMDGVGEGDTSLAEVIEQKKAYDEEVKKNEVSELSEGKELEIANGVRNAGNHNMSSEMVNTPEVVMVRGVKKEVEISHLKLQDLADKGAAIKKNGNEITDLKNLPKGVYTVEFGDQKVTLSLGYHQRLIMDRDNFNSLMENAGMASIKLENTGGSSWTTIYEKQSDGSYRPMPTNFTITEFGSDSNILDPQALFSLKNGEELFFKLSLIDSFNIGFRDGYVKALENYRANPTTDNLKKLDAIKNEIYEQVSIYVVTGNNDTVGNLKGAAEDVESTEQFRAIRRYAAELIFEKYDRDSEVGERDESILSGEIDSFTQEVYSLPFTTKVTSVFIGAPNLTVDIGEEGVTIRRNKFTDKGIKMVKGFGIVEGGKVQSNEGTPIDTSKINTQFIDKIQEPTPFVVIEYENQKVAYPISVSSESNSLAEKVQALYDSDNTNGKLAAELISTLSENGVDPSQFNIRHIGDDTFFGSKEEQDMLAFIEGKKDVVSKEEFLSKEYGIDKLQEQGEISVNLENKPFQSLKIKVDLKSTIPYVREAQAEERARFEITGKASKITLESIANQLLSKEQSELSQFHKKVLSLYEKEIRDMVKEKIKLSNVKAAQSQNQKNKPC